MSIDFEIARKRPRAYWPLPSTADKSGHDLALTPVAETWINQHVNPSAEYTTGATVNVRRNLAFNPNVEAAGNVQAAGTASGTLERTTEQAYNGTNSMKMTITATTGGVSKGITWAIEHQTTGNISWRCWVYSPTAITVSPLWEGAVISTSGYAGQTQTGVAVPANTWTEIVGFYTIPADRRVQVVGMVVSNTTVGQVFYADYCLATLNDEMPDYFDGSTPASGEFTFAWNGAVNASVSLQRAVAVTGGWTSFNSNNSWWRSNARSRGGTYSMACMVKGRGAANILPNGNGYVTVKPNTLYTISTWIWSPVAFTMGQAIRFSSNNGSGDVYIVDIGSPNVAIPANTWTEVRMQATSPAGANQSSQRLTSVQGQPTIPIGTIIYADHTMYVEGNYTGTWFSGGTTDANPKFTYAWAGTPDNSVSYYRTTPNDGPPLALQTPKAPRLVNDQHYTTSTPVLLYKDRQHVPFALECLVRHAGPISGRRLLMGRETAGLFMTPTGFEFYAETPDGNVTSKYELAEFTKVYHVVVNYTDGLARVIVNGEGGNAAVVTGFNNTDPVFYVGGSTTKAAAPIFMSHATIHRAPLSDADIRTHMNSAWSTVPEFQVQQAYGAVGYDFTDNSGKVGSYLLDDPTRLHEGQNTEIEVLDGAFTLTDDAAEPGVRISPPITLDPLDVIDGSRIDWDASPTGVTVEASINGSTWAVCTNHATIPGLGEGVDTSEKTLQLRYTLNVQEPAPWIRNARAKVYVSKNPSSQMPNWTMTVQEPFHLAEYNSVAIVNDIYSTARLRKPGRLTVPAPPGVNIRTFEIWCRKPSVASTNGINEFIFDGRASDGTGGQYWLYEQPPNGNNLYASAASWCMTNGEERIPTVADFADGKIVHIVQEFPTAITNTVTIGARYSNTQHSDLDILCLALYGEPIGRQMAKDNYRWGMGHTVLSFSDTCGTIREGVGQVYKYPWAIEIGAG